MREKYCTIADKPWLSEQAVCVCDEAVAPRDRSADEALKQLREVAAEALPNLQAS